MKKLMTLAGAALMLATPALADPALGEWKTEPGETGGYLHVNIAKCGEQVCGTILKAVDKAGVLVEDYEHEGKPIIWNMDIDGGGSYSGGTIWAPDVDKKYASKMKMNGATLVVSGCVAGGLICRGQDWTKP